MPNTLYDALYLPHEGSDKIFLTNGPELELTYAHFLAIAGRYSNVFRNIGIGVGDRVVLQAAKSPQALAIYAACAKSGAVFLPLNTAYTASEVEYFVRDSEAGLLICDPGSAAELSPITESTGTRLLTLDGAGQGSFAELAATQSHDFVTVDRGEDDLAAILYTSGTTGRSKGAMLTHKNLLSNAQALVECWRFNADDVLLHALPIFHTHGLFVATNVLLMAGGSIIFQSSFNLDEIIDALPNATSMMGVPTFYTRILSDPRFDHDLVDHMRLFTSGSAPLLAETHNEFEARTGHRILERYGMTETNMNTSNPYDGERRAGTVGFPLPEVDLRICESESGEEVEKGNIGVIEVKGPNVFKGYWNMPEKTAEEFRDDGYFITGDLARLDDDGYVQIVGREKDLIISGGYNIYPKELELLIDDLPGVLESAVIGVPHAAFGEGVVAIIVPQSQKALDEGELANALNGKIARFKQPKRIVVLEELPRNTMGKVQKNVLRERFANLLS
ncbi:MAG: malonate--CoA ligase [Rhizobiaceae bacterium]